LLGDGGARVILTLTPNPTIDRAVFCRDFHLGDIVRAERELVIPSGKGVDASLVLHELGSETCVLGLQAGLNGRLHADLLDQWGITHDMVPAHGETRMAIVLVDLAVNRQSTISAPTLAAGEEQLAGLLDSVRQHAEGAWGLICGGSLPPGLPQDSYARLVRCARECGLVTLLDTSRDSLCQGVLGHPDILKINLAELRGLIESDVGARSSRSRAGLPRPYIGDVDGLDLDRLGEWARFLVGYLGVWAGQSIVITLGDDGALAVTKEASYVVRPPSVPVVNTAGAGDALDAGLMLARSQGHDWPDALALGTAAAASVVMNEGTAICRREQVGELLRQVRVHRLTIDE
jgi:1-phosphofructokinase family hexose kinase